MRGTAGDLMHVCIEPGPNATRPSVTIDVRLRSAREMTPDVRQAVGYERKTLDRFFFFLFFFF